jgi:hypothetical protein
MIRSFCALALLVTAACSAAPPDPPPPSEPPPAPVEHVTPQMRPNPLCDGECAPGWVCTIHGCMPGGDGL